MKKYILIGKEPAVTEDLFLWASSFENDNRRVAFTDFYYCTVSTIFLGIDHSFYGGNPILFETMIFGHYDDLYQTRYHTWEESVKGHIVAVEKVIPFWKKNLKSDFVWELFKVTFTAIFLAVFALFLCVIL